MEEFVGGLRGRLALSLLQEAGPDDEGPRRPVTVVVGNESCDLDSAACAIVLAYFLHTRELLQERLIIPVLNVRSEDLPLKTDVVNVLHTLGVQAADVPRLEEIDCKVLRDRGLLRLIIVDHHNLFDPELEDCLEEVIDHRPVSSLLPKSCQGDAPRVKTSIHPVGSCATLVLKRIWEVNPDFRDSEALRLIRFAIVTDTVNFSEEAKKTTQDDKDIVNRIDLLLGLDTLSRTVDYQLVLAAKTDISGLNNTQLLKKDLKIIKSEDGKWMLAMSSLMMSASQFVKREGFEEDALSFLESQSCHGLVIMGSIVGKDENNEEKFERDLAVYPTNDCELTKNILENLPKYDELKLQEIDTSCDGKFCVFSQGDVSFSRKKVMPLIKDIMCKI